MNFLSIKSVVPSKRIGNDDHIGDVVSRNAGHLGASTAGELGQLMSTLFAHAGSQDRYVRDHGETPIELTTMAGKAAIDKAGIDPEDIDLLIFVGVGRGFLEPATSNVFQDRLGLTRATCFDLLDACASWLRALHVAHSFLETGAYRRIMILNGEFNSNYANFHFETLADLKHNFAQFTIGEAATATIVEATDADSSYFGSFRTYGHLRNLCMIPLPNFAEYNGETPSFASPLRFFSQSHELFEEGISRLVQHFHEEEPIRSFVPDVVFGHAASDSASVRTADLCGLPPEAVYKIHARFGNVVSASVPLAMSCARDEGRLKHGDSVLIGVASAGLSTGWTRLRFLTKPGN